MTPVMDIVIGAVAGSSVTLVGAWLKNRVENRRLLFDRRADFIRTHGAAITDADWAATKWLHKVYSHEGGENVPVGDDLAHLEHHRIEVSKLTPEFTAVFGADAAHAFADYNHFLYEVTHVASSGDACPLAERNTTEFDHLLHAIHQDVGVDKLATGKPLLARKHHKRKK
jgi:hypothetical protein